MEATVAWTQQEQFFFLFSGSVLLSLAPILLVGVNIPENQIAKSWSHWPSSKKDSRVRFGKCCN